MKAALISFYGGPEVLEIVDVPAPKPKDDEVAIRVVATSVNPVDWLIRDCGATSFVSVTFPVILGCDLAGEIVEVGAGVTRFVAGDAVFAMMPHDWGAHAERVAIPERFVVKKPASLSMEEAASLPVVAMTADLALRRRGQVRSGERVLVNGASGGVGLAAVQIAKALGAEVTAVCGAASFEQVKRLGADAVIDYKATDFTKESAQYDAIFDCIGNHPYGVRARAAWPASSPDDDPGPRDLLASVLEPALQDEGLRPRHERRRRGPRVPEIAGRGGRTSGATGGGATSSVSPSTHAIASHGTPPSTP
jgi:NADPH:quinone reductase-like Zn-dependent oxidoreductase